MGAHNMKTIEFTEEELSDGIHTVKSALEVYRAILKGRIPFDAPQEIMTELRLDERRMTKLCMQLEGNWVRVPPKLEIYEETCPSCSGTGASSSGRPCHNCYGVGRRRVVGCARSRLSII